MAKKSTIVKLAAETTITPSKATIPWPIPAVERSRQELVRVFDKLHADETFVVFKGGTCVTVERPALADAELVQQATTLLKEFGKEGGKGGASSSSSVDGEKGVLIQNPHPALQTWLRNDEVRRGMKDVCVVLLGRGKCDDDAAHPEVIHLSRK